MEESQHVDTSGAASESRASDNAREAIDSAIRELLRDLRAKRPGLFSKLALLGVFLASTVFVLTKLGEVVHSLAQVREALHPTPGPLEVWMAGAKDTFSRELLTSGFKRWRRTNVYISAVAKGWSRTEIDKAFDQYTEAVEEWDSRYMVNVLGLRQYYGKEPEEDFQETIQGWYRSSNDCVLALRAIETGRKDDSAMCEKVDAHNRGQVLDELQDVQSQIFYHFYRFSRSLDSGEAKGPRTYVSEKDVSGWLDR